MTKYAGLWKPGVRIQRFSMKSRAHSVQGNIACKQIWWKFILHASRNEVFMGGEGGDDSALEGQDRLEKNNEEK